MKINGKYSVLLFFLLLIEIPRVLEAGYLVGRGATSAEFLKIPVSARAISLGQSYTASYGDVSSLDYNPAGLAGLYRPELNAHHQTLFLDTSLSAFSLGFPTSLPSIASSLNNGAPFIPRDKFFWGFHYRALNADDEQRNDLGGKIGDFDIKDEALQMGLAYAVMDQLTLGGSAKMIKRKIKDESVTTSAFDAGMLFFVNEKLTLGLSMLNVGPAQTFISEADPLATVLRSGLQWRATRSLKILSDLSQGRDEIVRASMGSELSITSLIQVRAGAIYHRQAELTAGAGLVFPSFTKKPQTPPGPTANDAFESINNPAPKNTPPKNSPPLKAGLDYAARFNQLLGVNHSITFRLLF